LFCNDNQLTSLDVSNNLSLFFLLCGGNQLSSLDISKNTSLGSWNSRWTELGLSNMPSLYEVCVWTMPFPPDVDNGFNIDTTGSPNVYFTTECSSNTEIGEYTNQDLSIYPNPFTDHTTIRLSDAIHVQNIDLIDIYGRIVRTIENGNSNSVTIHRENLPSGIYFIRIHSDDTCVKKVIIR